MLLVNSAAPVFNSCRAQNVTEWSICFTFAFWSLENLPTIPADKSLNPKWLQRIAKKNKKGHLKVSKRLACRGISERIFRRSLATLKESQSLETQTSLAVHKNLEWVEKLLEACNKRWRISKESWRIAQRPPKTIDQWMAKTWQGKEWRGIVRDLWTAWDRGRSFWWVPALRCGRCRQTAPDPSCSGRRVPRSARCWRTARWPSPVRWPRRRTPNNQPYQQITHWVTVNLIKQSVNTETVIQWLVENSITNWSLNASQRNRMIIQWFAVVDTIENLIRNCSLNSNRFSWVTIQWLEIVDTIENLITNYSQNVNLLEQTNSFNDLKWFQISLVTNDWMKSSISSYKSFMELISKQSELKSSTVTHRIELNQHQRNHWTINKRPATSFRSITSPWWNWITLNNSVNEMRLI